MTQFAVAPLDPAFIAAAYPLVRTAAPEVGPDQWRRYAEWLRRAEGGVLGAFAGASTLHGIAAYCRDDSLRHGRSLRVDLIVTFELGRSTPARAALIAELERLARASHCDSLTLSLPSRGYADPAGAKAGGWSALGLDLDSVCFRKNLAPLAKTA